MFNSEYLITLGKMIQSQVRPLPKPSMSDYVDALQSQLMRRRKRDTTDVVTEDEAARAQRLGRKNGRRNLNTTAVPAVAGATAASAAAVALDVDVDTGDGQVRGKPKSPCQVCGGNGDGS